MSFTLAAAGVTAIKAVNFVINHQDLFLGIGNNLLRAFSEGQNRKTIKQHWDNRDKYDQQRLEIQKKYYESIGELEENKFFLNNAWPLTMPPKCFSTPLKNNNKVVFRVILAQSPDKEYQNSIGNSVKNSLHSSVSELFSGNEDRPIQFYFDSWKSDFNGNNNSIDGLYQVMKMQPTLVIIPVLSDRGETLIIRTAFWGFGINADNPTSMDFLRIPLGKVKREVSREFAKRWREFKSKFTDEQAQLDLDDVNPTDEMNLKYLVMEEQFINKDVNTDDLERNTKIYRKYCTDDDRMYEDVTNYIVACIESVISFITDAYCYIEYGSSPTMPYVLSSLNHASYLASVAQQILPLYQNTFSFIVESNKTSFLKSIECYSIQVLSKKIKYLLDCSDMNFKGIDSSSCATRLIWDEELSKRLKKWFGKKPDNTMKQAVVEYLRPIICKLDDNCKVDGIDRFVDKLSIDVNKDSIIFSINSRHTIISEFQHFIALASYRIYEDTNQEKEGINWFTAYGIAEQIVSKCENKGSHKLNFTPAMFLTYEKYEEDLTRIIENTFIQWKVINSKVSAQNKKIVAECKKDVILIENIRKIADLLICYGREEGKHTKEESE